MSKIKVDLVSASCPLLAVTITVYWNVSLITVVCSRPEDMPLAMMTLLQRMSLLKAWEGVSGGGVGGPAAETDSHPANGNWQWHGLISPHFQSFVLSLLFPNPPPLELSGRDGNWFEWAPDLFAAMGDLECRCKWQFSLVSDSGNWLISWFAFPRPRALRKPHLTGLLVGLFLILARNASP